MANYRKRNSQHTGPAYAPYNFVPLPKSVLINETDSDSNEKYSGELEVTLESKTPIFIGGDTIKGTDEDDNVATRKNFFNYDNPMQPVIPGSSMRGMIRTVSEIISYSRLGFFSDKSLIMREVAGITNVGKSYRNKFCPSLGSNKLEYPTSRMKAGYLLEENGRYFIQPAKVINGTSFVHVENKLLHRRHVGDTEVLYIKKDDVQLTYYPKCSMLKLFYIKDAQSRKNKTYNLKVTAFISGKMHKKHMEIAVFDRDDKADRLEIEYDVWRTFDEDQKAHKGIKGRIVKANDIVLYFENEEKPGFVDYLGSTMMFRYPYMHSIKEFVKYESDDTDRYDMTQNLFGFVDDNSGESIKGKVFFSDLKLATEGYPFYGGDYGDEHGFNRLHLLASPKPTSYQLYLEQAGEYDKNKLKGWNDVTSTKIRGFKQYWHKLCPDEKMFADTTLDTRQTNLKMALEVRAVSPKTKFKGKIRFKNISLLELGLLLHAIEIPGGCCHKLGMGKPLGLGTVKIEVSELVVFDSKKRYSSFFDEAGNISVGNREDVKALKKEAKEKFSKLITEFDNCKSTNIWETERLSSFKRLLSWEKQTNEAKYMELTDKLWNKKAVLPLPTAIHLKANKRLIEERKKNRQEYVVTAANELTDDCEEIIQATISKVDKNWVAEWEKDGKVMKAISDGTTWIPEDKRGSVNKKYKNKMSKNKTYKKDVYVRKEGDKYILHLLKT